VFHGLRFVLALAGAAFRSFFKIGPLAFIGIAWLIYENWETVKNFLMKIWEKVEPYWLKFKAILEEYGVVDKIVAAWTSVRDFFTTIWNTAQTYWLSFKAILDEYGVTDKIVAGWNAVKSLFEGIWKVVEPHWLKFKEILDRFGVVDKIIVAGTMVKNFYIDLFKGFFRQMVSFWSTVFEKIQSFVKEVNAAWTSVRDFFSGILNAITTGWNSFIKKIKDSVTGLKNFFKGIGGGIASVWDKITGSIPKFGGGANPSVSSVGNLLRSNETKPSIASNLPSLSGAKAAPVTKNQNVNVAVNVNASKISDPREVAKQVSKEMKSFNWNYLYDPVGALP
jgi:phage-related protein